MQRLLRLMGVMTLLSVVLVLAAPWIIAQTGLRDRLINAIMGTPNLSASTQRASFGWFSPLAIEDVRIDGKLRRFRVELESLTADRSWPGLLASSPELGMIAIDKPHVQLLLPLGERGTRSTILSPTFTAVVSDAVLTVRTSESDEPVIDVDGIDMTLHVQQADEGRLLTLDPLDVFTRRKLTPKLCNRLLHLMNPSLRDATQVEGEFSLSLDKLRIPIGIPEDQLIRQIEVEGELALHRVSIEAQSPILQALAKLLADIHGKETPETIRVVKDAAIRFQVRDGRVFHEGLRLGFPDIAPGLLISSRGSVGLDETLDLYLEVPRLDKAKLEERGPVQCHITGTLTKPRLFAKDASLVIHLPNRPEALIDMDGIDLIVQVEDSPTGRVLTVDPVEVFKREKLSRRLASSLVHLIEPETRYSPELTGEISLTLDKLRIPLGLSEEEWLSGLVVHGKLAIHQVATVAKDPMRQAIVKLLADLYGKEAAEVVRVAHDTEIDFQLRDGRLHYEGLRFGFPDIDPELLVTSQGSVGLDETLDLHLELPRLDKAKLAERGPVQCHITGTMSNPQLSVKDASLVVRMAEYDQPLLDVDAIDVTMHVETEEDVRMLALAPVKVFDKQKLTPALNDELLRLVAPTLGDVADVQGNVSLTLDTFRVPLGASKDQLVKGVELTGRLQLHEVSMTVETPLLSAMVKVLADLYGKKPSEVIRVVKDADIRFEVRNGRLFHEGLSIGFPDISPELLGTSRGSVGLDKSLDLIVEVPSVLAKADEAPGDTGSDHVRLKITGTIDKPTVVEIKDQ